MKRALITGVTGQDGSYLSELLIEKGYRVFGLLRRCSTDPLMRISKIVNSGDLKLINGDMRDVDAIRKALQEAKPDEIYNLAAQSDVGISFKCPDETFEINHMGVGRLVGQVMEICPNARIYQASTSEMFGSSPPPQSENTPFKPVSPYAKAKLRAHEDFVCGYRERHGLFICSGILFNHESPRRGKHFVTKKITLGLSRFVMGKNKPLEMGNLEARRDWGYAKDYVGAMWLMLQQDEPEDFVIATGESHSVKEFVERTAFQLGICLQWKGTGRDTLGFDQETGNLVVKTESRFYRENEVDYLCGDSSKAQKKLGWKPKTDFEGLIKIMVDNDVREALQEI